MMKKAVGKQSRLRRVLLFVMVFWLAFAGTFSALSYVHSDGIWEAKREGEVRSSEYTFREFSGITLYDSMYGYTGYKLVRTYELEGYKCGMGKITWSGIPRGYHEMEVATYNGLTSRDVKYDVQLFWDGGYEVVSVGCNDVLGHGATQLVVAVSYKFEDLNLSYEAYGEDSWYTNRTGLEYYEEYIENKDYYLKAGVDVGVDGFERMEDLVKFAKGFNSLDEVVEWFKENMQYISNQDDGFRMPYDVLADGGGDCDELALLFNVLLGGMKEPVKAYVRVGLLLSNMIYEHVDSMDADELRKEFGHAVSIVRIEDRWVPIDLTALVGYGTLETPFLTMSPYLEKKQEREYKDRIELVK